jgi:predicted DNA-binding protein
MRKGFKKENSLDCTISIRISKEEKDKINHMKSKCFNISKYFRDVVNNAYNQMEKK